MEPRSQRQPISKWYKATDTRVLAACALKWSRFEQRSYGLYAFGYSPIPLIYRKQATLLYLSSVLVIPLG